jgi:hypothetical protein
MHAASCVTLKASIALTRLLCRKHTTMLACRNAKLSVTDRPNQCSKWGLPPAVRMHYTAYIYRKVL